MGGVQICEGGSNPLLYRDKGQPLVIRQRHFQEEQLFKGVKLVGNYANVLLSLRLRKKAKIKGVSVQSVAKSTFLIFFECNELSRESLLSKKKKQYLSVWPFFHQDTT